MFTLVEPHMFTLVVAVYVVVVFVARVFITSRQAQEAFRAGLTNRQAPQLESDLGGLWAAANALVPESKWRYVPNRKILQAWQILHHIDAERDQGKPADIQMALAAEFDRQKGKNSELNKLLASSLASPQKPPAQPFEMAPASALAHIGAFLLNNPAGNFGSNIAATSSGTEAQRTAALRAARRINDAQRDRIAAQQADLGRRGLFLLVLGGAAVVLAGHLLHHELLLGVGAGAGILSRLSSRSNEVKRSGTDYGVAWTKLIVSPLVGALGALFGVFLIGGLGNAGFFGPSICPLITPVVIDLAPTSVTTTTPTTTTTTIKPGNGAQTSPNKLTTERSSQPAKTPADASEAPVQSPQQSPTQSPTQTTTTDEQLRSLAAAWILPPPSPTDTVAIPETTTEPTDLGTEPLPPEQIATTTTTTVTSLSTILTPAQPCPTSASPINPGVPPIKQDRESTTTIALAIVLGFSERLFARMIGRSENYITGELEGTNTKGGNG